MNRRQLLNRAWAILGVTALAEAAWVTVSFLVPRRPAAAGAGLFVAGPVDRFEPDTVTAFPSGQFYLARLADGGFLALHRECTHLGCTVPWDATARRFVCPCHASTFDVAGRVLASPAPRPLDYYAVRIENGQVKVDLGRRQTRQDFDPAQVTTP